MKTPLMPRHQGCSLQNDPQSVIDFSGDQLMARTGWMYAIVAYIRNAGLIHKRLELISQFDKRQTILLSDASGNLGTQRHLLPIYLPMLLCYTAFKSKRLKNEYPGIREGLAHLVDKQA